MPIPLQRIAFVLVIAVVPSIVGMGCKKRTAAESKAIPITIVTIPTNYDGKAEMPVVVMLHGMDSKPDDFLGDEFEDIANALKVVVVAVSGPIMDDHGDYAWSDD